MTAYVGAISGYVSILNRGHLTTHGAIDEYYSTLSNVSCCFAVSIIGFSGNNYYYVQNECG